MISSWFPSNSISNRHKYHFVVHFIKMKSNNDLNSINPLISLNSSLILVLVVESNKNGCPECRRNMLICFDVRSRCMVIPFDSELIWITFSCEIGKRKKKIRVINNKIMTFYSPHHMNKMIFRKNTFAYSG